MRRIIHVDMDAFYASVEQHDRPELRGQPVIVAGSEKGRGVVLTASYEARKFGLRSAMPTSRALRLCPQVIRVDPRMSRYREISRHVHEIFSRYTTQVEPLSLDESFLDVTARCDEQGVTARDVAVSIKAAIRSELGLTASAGVGPNKFVAKVASDLQKPDGLVVVPPAKVEAFLRPLGVERVWGVGPVTATRLRDRGIRTIADLADASLEVLTSLLGRGAAGFQMLARGLDERPVSGDHERRSISCEETFAEDVSLPALLLEQMRAQADELSGRLQRNEVLARTVTLKLRYADFTTITRSATLPTPCENSETLLEIARGLLERTEFPQRPVRLIGLGAAGLQPATRPVQLTLF
jgi:DNA polymerase-4